MFRYVVQRLGIMIPTLLLISFLVFVVIQAPPGDYLSTYIEELRSQGAAVDPARIAAIRAEYGLDKPFIVQYLTWVGGLLRGDMGYSFEYGLPVSQLVGDKLLLTMIVSIGTILFIWIVSFPIALYSATHQYSVGDYFASFLGFLGLATPSFLFALVLLYFTHIWFGISIGGLMDPQYLDQPWSWGKVGSLLSLLWIPSSSSAPRAPPAIRRLRVICSTAAEAICDRPGGACRRAAFGKYPLRMSLNPFIADIGSVLPEVISGAVVVSVVMSLPTTGPMLLDALRSQDMYLAGSFLMFLALLTVIGVFISDLLLAVLDPRIRLSGGATK
jgi:peptide/nickel transport system permease protein